jgi:hypothetical protein
MGCGDHVGGPTGLGHGGGFFARPGLIAVAVAIPMAEAGLVSAFAPAARALAPQVTALAPLAVYHDLRWVFGSGRTWLDFALILIGVVLARSVLDAALAWLSWPRGQPRPRPVILLGSGALLTLCAALLLFPLVTVAFGVALLPFSWPFLGALPLLVLLGLLLSHGSTASWWWRMLPTIRAAGWLITDFAALSLAAVVISRVPGGWAIPVAGLGGMVNARAWYGVTTSVAAPRPAGRWRLATWPIPVAPMAAVLAVAMVVGVAREGFEAAGGTPHPARASSAAAPPGLTPGQGPISPARPAPAVTGTAKGPAVLEVAGFGSHCCSGSPALQAIAGHGTVQQFSYLGLDAHGRPRPYQPAASDLPLPVLGDRIAAQVEQLHRDTGQLVDVVAESEGTLGVYAMLSRHPGVPVRSIVMLSPIVAPGQVSYPTVDEGGGGTVAADALRAVVWFIGGLSPFGNTGADKLIDSVNSTGALYAEDAVRDSRDRPYRWLAVIPLADTLTLPSCALPVQAVVVPGLHGGLLGDPDVQRTVRGFLAGRPVRTTARLRDAASIVTQAASAWRMPELQRPSPPCPGPGA